MARVVGRPWRRDELLIAFRLYCQIPFGRLHKSNPTIIHVAHALGRSPSSLAMKLVNFASLDPIQKERGIKGLKNVSEADKNIWKEFVKDWEARVEESENQLKMLSLDSIVDRALENQTPLNETKTQKSGTTNVRLVQGFFRSAVLSAYRYMCAICSLDMPQLLNASHIIPWSVNEKMRADPTNGLSLCTLHDRAFDRGIIAIDQDLRVRVSSAVPKTTSSKLLEIGLVNAAGGKIVQPDRFAPSMEALAYHRRNIFLP